MPIPFFVEDVGHDLSADGAQHEGDDKGREVFEWGGGCNHEDSGEGHKKTGPTHDRTEILGAWGLRRMECVRMY